MLQTKELSIPSEAYEKCATLYFDTQHKPKACILYFHGGGLLYGTRTDLPRLHQQFLTENGYCIIAYDYPLAPAAKLEQILADICASVNHYIENPSFYLKEFSKSGSDGDSRSSSEHDSKEFRNAPKTAPDDPLPYFLWGRSAGAYLCLLAGASGKLAKKPTGIISYYGYGFLCDGWFLTPSNYYCTLPPVGESAVSAVPSEIHAGGDLNTHYSVYVYARQTGKWIDLIYEGRQKFFYLDFTLRTCDKLPCPLFCAHSTGDTDVPYSEFLELCSKYQPKRFVASHNMHDFDRDEANPVTMRLLEATLQFAELKLSSKNADARET